MSMPSSRLDVATRPLRRPDLSSSSIWRRRSREREPWWAFTSSSCTGGVPSDSAERFSPSQCSSLSRVAKRSARRRAFTKISVERFSFTSSSNRGCMAGQIEWRTGPAAAGPEVGSSMMRPSSAMSSTGMTTSISSRLRTPASTTVTGRGRRSPPAASSVPPRNRAISSRGRCVAERPIRCGDRPPPWRTQWSSRSSVTAMWLPRLVAASAWISSTITASTPSKVSRAAEVSMR